MPYIREMDFTFDYGAWAGKNKQIPRASAVQIVINGQICYKVTFNDMPPFVIQPEKHSKFTNLFWNQIRIEDDQEHPYDFIQAIGKGLESVL